MERKPEDAQKNGMTKRLRVLVGSSRATRCEAPPNCPADNSMTASNPGPSLNTSTPTGYQAPARTTPLATSPYPGKMSNWMRA